MYGGLLVLLVLAADPTPVEGRKLTEIGREMTAALKREATAKSLPDRADAIRELVALFTELRRDPRSVEHDLAKNYRGQLGNRLARTRDDLKRLLAQQERKTSRSPAPHSQADDEALLFAMDSLASALSASDTLAGSPGLAFNRGGQAVIADNGQALVDLIERTINPAFWDTNGGTGSVIYYAPLMCLVVNATGGVHEELGGLLDGVRAAGR